MTTEPRLSDRLAAVVDALPLRPGLRVLEIGGAPGTAARAVARRIGDGHILVIDRSAKGVAQTEQNAAAEIAAGLLSVRHVAAEDFELLGDEAPFDLAFAIRVGALDGRHPQAGVRARQRIAAALTPTGRLFIDGGDPLRVLELADAQGVIASPWTTDGVGSRPLNPTSHL
jgi:SAM-dependent methyltransferase